MSHAFTFVIPVYQGVTHLDFTGPHQFFARLPQAQVVVASVGGRPVSADGLTFANLVPLESVERCDVLCVPGGVGCVEVIENPGYMREIARLASGARYVTSVCTGSLVLGAAGLLRGKRAACHWAWREFLPLFGAIPDLGRVVRDGNVITGGGVTAGIDFALVVMAELAGRAAAEAVQLGLEYAPQPPFDAGRPETAPGPVRDAVVARIGERLKPHRVVFERVAAGCAA
ncbi:isonitrile hydratase [mine drainage metagenome]|uniref:Isonitrile hydratase n=1 Tax=mine drainage metagenome TaxID=410659 RepID=A0A1J5SQT2_9ZZZZ